MRIIAGTYKGRKLYSPRGSWLRPTTDRVKTYIFDKIGFAIKKSRVLDLFAGSGSLGIEALSRGATHATFVDNSKRSIDIIKNNLSIINNPENVDIIYSDVNRFLKSKDEEHDQYDIIFADPPYDLNKEEIIQSVLRNKLLAINGLFMYEQRTKGTLFFQKNMRFAIEKKSFGTTSVLWFRRLER